jgi:hypothetical protein
MTNNNQFSANDQMQKITDVFMKIGFSQPAIVVLASAVGGASFGFFQEYTRKSFSTVQVRRLTSLKAGGYMGLRVGVRIT